MRLPRHRFSLILVVFSLILLAALVAPRVHVASNTLPRQVSDHAFWQMIVDFSERGGFFRSDNLISNESTFQQVIPELKQRAAGGVYVGVGPDQNFTYITALQPRIAFVVDIRRQNMLLHLMYKAIIEMSEDRADFLSRLFSRPRPLHLDRTSTPQTLFEAYEAATPSDALFRKNLRAILDRLVVTHHFGLTSDDIHSIEFVYRAFYLGGPDLRYSFPQQFGGRFPTYAELMMESDRTGHNHSYLATEDNFRFLKELEKDNLLVPLVGDFGGDKVVRRVGGYVREHGATVTTFYTSNVEQYLFQTDAWSRFFDNVATMPIDEHSTFIRSYFDTRFRSSRSPNVGLRSETLLDSIAEILTAFRNGQIQNYDDVIARSK
jgi:hypothetical protein